MTAPSDGKKTEEKLSMLSMICFGMGGMPSMVCNTAINFFIPLFILEVVKLQPYEVSIIVFTGKFWDAMTDPIVGYLVSRSPCRLKGRLTPWILFSSPIASTWYFLFWYVPDIPREAYLAWYLMAYCLFQTFMTTFQVPYTSLTMYLSNDQKQRDKATAVRIGCEVTAIVLSVVVQGQLINLTRTVDSCSNDTNQTFTETEQRGTYMLASIIFCVIYCICGLCVFLGVTEREGNVREKPEPFFTSLKLVFKHRSYVMLVLTCLFVFLANAIVQGNISLYLTHSVGLGDWFSYLVLAMLIMSIITIPFWHFIAVKYGKKISFGAGIIVQIPVLSSLFVLPGNIYLAFGISVLGGCGLSVTFFLPWLMLPDTLDEYMLKTGNRKDTIFYSFFVFLYKLSSGVALGLSQLILQAGGYDSTACKQPQSVGHTLRFILSPLPVFLYIIGLIFIYKYPVNKKTRKRTQQLLADRSVKEEENGQGKDEVPKVKNTGIDSFDNPAFAWSKEE